MITKLYFKKFDIDGRPMYLFKSCEGVICYDKLPFEYLQTNPSYYGYPVYKGIMVTMSDGSFIALNPDNTALSEPSLKRMINDMKIAGNRLVTIRKKESLMCFEI